MVAAAADSSVSPGCTVTTGPASAKAAAERRPQVLVIAPHGSYRTAPFLAAAHDLGVDVLIASPGKHSIVSAYADGLHIDLHDPEAAVRAIEEQARRRPFAAVIPTDDSTTEIAALAARALHLPHNPPEAVRYTQRKDLARARLQAADVPAPAHRVVDLRRPLAGQLESVRFPCVAKPVSLSASRGVIRADDPEGLRAALARIERILAKEHELTEEEHRHVLVEDFIPGTEVAVEGLLEHGRLRLLAVFDKPDPLDGPYFEETYYITPSRLPPRVQEQIRQQIHAACAAYGLREGPIHAECRINDAGIWVLEVAARTIGGLCARLLRVGTGFGLEELVLTHALGRPLALPADTGAAGVLMIPTTTAGILRRVEGQSAARAVPFIEEVVIYIREGYELVPWPEGSSYLGFIFSRAPTPQQAEAALRAAHAQLNIVVAPLWKGNLAIAAGSTPGVAAGTASAFV